MPLPPEFRSPLELGDYDTLEDIWVQRLAEAPHDVAPFAAAARELAARDEEERARFLLELVDAELRSRGLHRARLDLLRRAGTVLLPPERVHPEILGTLAELYGAGDTFDGVVEAVGLRRAPHDLPKSWEKVERLEQILAYDVGTLVAMNGQGVGRVVELNFPLESLKVEFAGGRNLHVGFRAAPKVLEKLPPGHILRRTVEEPEELARLVAEDPSELLRVVLESRGRPLTAGEIKQDLATVVPDSSWTSFWAAARKHPQVVVGGKGRQTYAWAASSDHAVEAVWAAFERAAPRKRIDLLRREGDREPELAGRMAAELAALGESAAGSDPGLAYEIWAGLERAGRAAAAAALSPDRLLGGDRRLLDTLLSGLEDRSLKEDAYRSIRRLRDDWREVFFDRMGREEDPKSLDLLHDELVADAGGTPSRALARFLDAAVSQPHRQPAAFTWLAERAARDPALLCRNPLRLLQQILAAPHREELAPYRARLKALGEKGGTLLRLVPELAEEQAAAASDAVHRAALLEAYQRDNLQHALERQFPSLTGEQAAVDVLWALPASIAARRAELEDIARKELPANRKAIAEARAMGDLRENFEYKAARQRHEYLTARATKLDRELGRVQTLDLAKVDPAQIRVGTRFRIELEGGDERTLTLLGPWESDPDRGVLSYQSELGQSLLGKAVGEAVQVEGKAGTVRSIEVAEPPAAG